MDVNTPKYMTLVNWVNGEIAAKKLNGGDKLYSENEFSTMFHMSRQTVRHAISLLEHRNIVERRQGSGTYISRQISENKTATMNIAIVTTYVDDYIFPTIIREIEKILLKEGYTVQIAYTHNMMEKELGVLQNILSRNMVDGIIIEPTKSGIPNPNRDIYDEIMKRNIPTIFMNSYYPGIDIPHVSMDDKEAGLIAVNYLVAAGHRRIAGIFKFDDIQGHLRYAGYAKGMQEANLRINAEDIIWFDTEDMSNIDTNIGRILKRLEGCTACVCYNDQLALEIVRICLANNIRIPEQMSIVSIDNSDIANLCEVPLTSVALPMVDLGKTLANNLLEKIKDSSFNATMEFRPLLVERKSVKNIGQILPEDK